MGLKILSNILWKIALVSKVVGCDMTAENTRWWWYTRRAFSQAKKEVLYQIAMRYRKRIKKIATIDIQRHFVGFCIGQYKVRLGFGQGSLPILQATPINPVIIFDSDGLCFCPIRQEKAHPAFFHSHSLKPHRCYRSIHSQPTAPKRSRGWARMDDDIGQRWSHLARLF